MATGLAWISVHTNWKKEKNQPNDQENITRLNIKMNQTQLPISFLENVYDLTNIKTNWFGLKQKKKKTKTNVCLKLDQTNSWRAQ